MTCPRCNVPGLRSGDEYFCLNHGTFYTPVRAWDAPSTVIEQEKRNRATVTPFLRWGEKDTEVWENWQEGDPVCEGNCGIYSEVKLHLSGCKPIPRRTRVREYKKTAINSQLSLGF